jgi:alpha-1,6-mannosyltransferase
VATTTTLAIRSRERPLAARLELAGTLALAGLVAAIALLAAASAAAPSRIIPRARADFFPGWLAGPLHGLSPALSIGALQALIGVACACYLVALGYAGRLGTRRLWAAIILANIAATLAPPLFSADVFGYVGYARLAALHGLNPYLVGAGAAAHDPISGLVGWPTLTTPYGPLFTLASEALVPFGIAGAVWAFKVLAALLSLATVALLWRAAPAFGRSRNAAIALFGLNPVVLVFAVPGAHNEALLALLTAAAALCVASGHNARAGVAAVAAAAVKASSALLLPFVLIGSARRNAAALAMAASIVCVAVIAIAAFGPHPAALVGALTTQQGKVAGHSIPSEVSKLLGLGMLALGVRIAFLVALAAVLAAMMRRALRGAPWLDCYGWTTLALLCSTAWLWPWYGLWAILPASLSKSRALRAATVVATLYLVAIRVLVHNPLSAG